MNRSCPYNACTMHGTVMCTNCTGIDVRVTWEHGTWESRKLEWTNGRMDEWTNGRMETLESPTWQDYKYSAKILNYCDNTKSHITANQTDTHARISFQVSRIYNERIEV